MELSVGILIIGSLYWDNEGGRDHWRTSRLDAERKWFVQAPIRYGRRAKSRNDTYTMVFSQLPPDKLGQSIVLQCRQPIRSQDDLVTEARWLWSAETKGVPTSEQPDLPPTLQSTWGCVALLARPRGCFHSVPRIQRQLLDRWSQVSSQRDDELLLTDRGILGISWPDCIGGRGPVPLDLLLATTNRPCPQHIPSPRSVAEEWNERGFRNYFDENQKAGILTYQDQEIKQYLR